VHRILCFGAVCALALSEQLSGTCTIAIAARDFGILAADCIATRHDGSSRSVACKMHASNGLAVTLAGLVSDGNTGLDLMNLAAAAMAKSDSPQEAADRFAATAIQEMARALERQHAEAPEMWHNRLGGVLARAVFIGAERGQAAVVVRTIGVSSEGLIQDLGSRVIVSEAIPRVVVFCEKAAELIRSDPSWKTLDPGRLAYQLIRASVAAPDGARSANPVSVTVIRVGKSGVNWLNRGACSEESSTTKRIERSGSK